MKKLTIVICLLSSPALAVPLPPPANACNTPAALHNPFCIGLGGGGGGGGGGNPPATPGKSAPTSTTSSRSSHNLTWLPWTIIGCVSGTVVSAMFANALQNRELTFNEAASCGIRYWLRLP